MRAKRKNPHAVALGRLGGRVVTPKKLAHLRRAAKFAGRKPKFAIGDRARANENAPGDYEDRIGIITEVGPGRAQYGIRFADGREPSTGHLMSWWLDRV